MIPGITLNDGTVIPQLGFGTYGIQPDAAAIPDNVATAAEVVGRALELGYRHIDTAQSYGSEPGIGRAIAQSAIPRDELYVTSKLSPLNFDPDDLRRSYDLTLEHLGLEQLDLFLIHWPMPKRTGDLYVSAWRTMTELVAEGRLRTAGVSNFMAHHLDRIVDEVGVAPAVNQIEIHPHFANTVTCAETRARGIAVEAWSPLGMGRRLFGVDGARIRPIAERHGKSVAQVVLRWHLDRGRIVIPRTVFTNEMEEDLALFDFELTEAETATIDSLDEGEAGRFGPHPDSFDY